MSSGFWQSSVEDKLNFGWQINCHPKSAFRPGIDRLVIARIKACSNRFSTDCRLDLFMHVQRQIIPASGVLATGARGFPSAKRLEARPGTRRGTLWSIGICHTGLDLIEEPARFFFTPVKSCSETVIDFIGMIHGFIEILNFTNGRNRQEHFVFP
jgi:hypothetical protein